MVCRSIVWNLNLNSNDVHCTLSRSSRFRFKEPFHSVKVNGVQFKDLLSLLIMEKNIILSAIFLIGCFCRLFAPKKELKFVTQGQGKLSNLVKKITPHSKKLWSLYFWHFSGG